MVATTCEYGCGGSTGHSGPCVMSAVKRDSAQRIVSLIWNCIERDENGEVWLDNLKASAHAKRFLTGAFQAGADARARECAGIAEDKGGAYEKLGDYGINQGYVRKVEAANDIAAAILERVGKAVED